MTSSPVPQPISETQVEQIEKELLERIIESMKSNTLPLEKAHELAKDFLAELPIEDKQDLLEKLRELAEKYPEARGVYVTYSKSEKEEERQRKLQQIAQQLHTGNFEDASKTMKGVV